jgi:hypothetical protein
MFFVFFFVDVLIFQTSGVKIFILCNFRVMGRFRIGFFFLIGLHTLLFLFLLKFYAEVIVHCLTMVMEQR